MRHFPVFLDLRGRRVVVSGAGETAVAKLRLLLKTEARIVVYGAEPDGQVRAWAAERRLTLVERPVELGDATSPGPRRSAGPAARSSTSSTISRTAPSSRPRSSTATR